MVIGASAAAATPADPTYTANTTNTLKMALFIVSTPVQSAISRMEGVPPLDFQNVNTNWPCSKGWNPIARRTVRCEASP
ncbi:hypothetical protein, partial [Magnetospirillum sp. UT-4]|uniref:hypothetical protein n=1 Tax=Magnetospirillum sp. UT-4 TaxID=2681467 RepID=UPI001C2CD684